LSRGALQSIGTEINNMRIDDLQGSVDVDGDEALLLRLRTVRKGPYGAFVLAHNDVGPLLFVHINGEVAYVHYFDDLSGRNAGWQPRDMTPPGCPPSVLFVQTDGNEGSGDAIEMPDFTLCGVDAAYQAAVQFLHDPARPACITWTDL
jgi:hypothetical protein